MKFFKRKKTVTDDFKSKLTHMPPPHCERCGTESAKSFIREYECEDCWNKLTPAEEQRGYQKWSAIYSSRGIPHI